MILRRPNLKDIISDKNSNICGSSILEKFHGNLFSQLTNSRISRKLIFTNRHFWVSKKQYNFANLAKTREIREIFFLQKFFPSKDNEEEAELQEQALAKRN